MSLHIRPGPTVTAIGVIGLSLALVDLAGDAGSILTKVASVVLDAGMVGFLGWLGIKLTGARESIAELRAEVTELQNQQEHSLSKSDAHRLSSDADEVHDQIRATLHDTTDELRRMIAAAADERVHIAADLRGIMERLDATSKRIDVNQGRLDDHRRLLDQVDEKDRLSRHDVQNKVHSELLEGFVRVERRLDRQDQRIDALQAITGNLQVRIAGRAE